MSLSLSLCFSLFECQFVRYALRLRALCANESVSVQFSHNRDYSNFYSRNLLRFLPLMRPDFE